MIKKQCGPDGDLLVPMRELRQLLAEPQVAARLEHELFAREGAPEAASFARAFARACAHRDG